MSIEELINPMETMSNIMIDHGSFSRDIIDNAMGKIQEYADKNDINLAFLFRYVAMDFMARMCAVNYSSIMESLHYEDPDKLLTIGKFIEHETIFVRAMAENLLEILQQDKRNEECTSPLN